MITLDISKIVEQGDLYEREFFNWLNVERISWCVSGTNLNYINIFNFEDIEVIKEYWYELKKE